MKALLQQYGSGRSERPRLPHQVAHLPLRKSVLPASNLQGVFHLSFSYFRATNDSWLTNQTISRYAENYHNDYFGFHPENIFRPGQNRNR